MESLKPVNWQSIPPAPASRGACRGLGTGSLPRRAAGWQRFLAFRIQVLNEALKDARQPSIPLVPVMPAVRRTKLILKTALFK